jgi:hypothetical protein
MVTVDPVDIEQAKAQALHAIGAADRIDDRKPRLPGITRAWGIERPIGPGPVDEADDLGRGASTAVMNLDRRLGRRDLWRLSGEPTDDHERRVIGGGRSAFVGQRHRIPSIEEGRDELRPLRSGERLGAAPFIEQHAGLAGGECRHRFSPSGVVGGS